MVAGDRRAPILVAAFPHGGRLWEAVRALEERRIGRDFIGVLISEDGSAPSGRSALHLLSVLAPRRLHEEIRAIFATYGAEATGGPGEMAVEYGGVPHPGVFQSHEMKLPMGPEYPDTRKRRGRGQV